MIVHREAGIEDDIIEAVQRRAAEAVLFGLGRQRRGGGKGGDAEDQIIIRIDITIEREMIALGVPNVVLQVEIGAVGAAEGEHFATGHAQRVEAMVLQAEIKMLDGRFSGSESRRDGETRSP